MLSRVESIVLGGAADFFLGLHGEGCLEMDLR